MLLTGKESLKFFQLQIPLLWYAGRQAGLIPEITFPDLFRLTSMEERVQCREQLFANSSLFDKFTEEYSDKLTEEDIEIIHGFKNFKYGQFNIVKHLKKHSIFMDDEHVYCVNSLSDPIKAITTKKLPALVRTALLPYKGKIIYDGMIEEYAIFYGAERKKDIKNKCRKLQAKQGLITSLPVQIKKIAPSKKLANYMKTQASTNANLYEIEELVNEHLELRSEYYYHIGRLSAPDKKKKLKYFGIKKQHFGLLNDTVVASGSTKKEVGAQIKKFLSPELQKSVFYFKI